MTQHKPLQHLTGTAAALAVLKEPAKSQIRDAPTAEAAAAPRRVRQAEQAIEATGKVEAAADARRFAKAEGQRD